MLRNLILVLGLLALCTPVFAQADAPIKRSAEELDAVMNRYVGRWAGSYEIRTLTRQVLQRLEVEQQYWWDRDDKGKRILKGQAVIASMGRISYSESKTFVVNGRIYSEIEQEDTLHLYAAKISDDGNSINWLAQDDDTFTAKKLSDTIVSKSDGTYLIIEGFEQVEMEEGPVMLVIQGELRKINDSVEAPAAGSSDP